MEGGRLLFSKPCCFLLSVTSPEHLPQGNACEVAFAGRSNVGKSSLINALTSRKSLARTSNTPGRTRELNFFSMGEKFCLVDMPGYGFAQAPKKKIKEWVGLIELYLAGRPQLRRVFLLIDARHGIKNTDLDIMCMLDQAAVVYQVVLTKTDKLTVSEASEIYQATSEKLRKHPAAYPEILLTSSHTGAGMDLLRAAIFDLMTKT